MPRSNYALFATAARLSRQQTINTATAKLWLHPARSDSIRAHDVSVIAKMVEERVFGTLDSIRAHDVDKIAKMVEDRVFGKLNATHAHDVGVIAEKVEDRVFGKLEPVITKASEEVKQLHDDRMLDETVKHNKHTRRHHDRVLFSTFALMLLAAFEFAVSHGDKMSFPSLAALSTTVGEIAVPQPAMTIDEEKTMEEEGHGEPKKTAGW
ncbi:hypothetical protein GGF32_003250 [Allomyces javanicus]|nr:hypothetical protein GGF32_003250 [Allomyces javanicus]